MVAWSTKWNDILMVHSAIFTLYFLHTLSTVFVSIWVSSGMRLRNTGKLTDWEYSPECVSYSSAWNKSHSLQVHYNSDQIGLQSVKKSRCWLRQQPKTDIKSIWFVQYLKRQFVFRLLMRNLETFMDGMKRLTVRPNARISIKVAKRLPWTL